MNLWFRLIWMLITSRWRGRAGLFDTTSLKFTVLPNDLDFNGHINNGRYLTLADIGRMDYVLRTGAARVALRHRALPIVGDVTAKFRRELRLFQRYELQSRLLGWHDKWTYMEHRFVHQGKVVGVVVMRGVFRAPDGPLAPQVFLEELNISAAPPPLPVWVLSWSQICDELSESLRREESAPEKTHAEAV